MGGEPDHPCSPWTCSHMFPIDDGYLCWTCMLENNPATPESVFPASFHFLERCLADFTSLLLPNSASFMRRLDSGGETSFFTSALLYAPGAAMRSLTTPVPGAAHINRALSLVFTFLRQVSSTHPTWPYPQQPPGFGHLVSLNAAPSTHLTASCFDVAAFTHMLQYSLTLYSYFASF